MSETNELREVEELKKEFFDFVEDTKSISETIRKNEEHIKRYEETISHLNPENIPEDLEMKKKLESKKEELIAEGPDLIKSFKIRYGDFEISDEDKKEKTIKEMEEGTIEGKATEVLQKMNKKRREIERKIEKNKINLEQIKLKIRAHDYSDTSVNILDLYKEEEKARDEIALAEKAMDECDKAIEDIKAFDKKKEFEEVLKNENVKNTKVVRKFDDKSEDIQPENTEPVSEQEENIQPENTEPVNEQEENIQPENTEPVNAQPANTRPVNAQPANARPVNAQPANARPVNAQPANARPVNAQPANTRPVNAQPANTRPVNAQPVERKDSVTIDSKTGLAVFYEEINGKSNQIAAITLEEALKSPRSVRRETFKYIKQYVEEKQGEKFEWKYRNFKRLNPVLLKLFLKAERNDLLSNYVKAANAEEDLKFEYNADMELGDSEAISDKTLYKLNNQLLKDNNDLGTQFEAVKHLRFWHLISRIPVLNTMRLPANTEGKKQDCEEISKNLQAKIDDKRSRLSEKLKEEFPIKNDFVFDFDKRGKESVKTFRDNGEEQTK